MHLNARIFVSTIVVLAAAGLAARAEEAGHAVGQPASAIPHVNQLSAKEKREGWKLLFDGKTLNGWRNFKKQDIAGGWKVTDGALCRIDSTAQDIVSADEYDNFELRLNYKVPAEANSGIMYRVSEDQDRPWMTGPEVQLRDNTDPQHDQIKSGWLYALYTPPTDPKTGKPLDATKPVGDWNEIRLICNGPHVETWMNGVKYYAFETGSDDWNQRVAASKFGKMPKFGKNTKGYIALQGDHGNVCFTNIKIRTLH